MKGVVDISPEMLAGNASPYMEIVAPKPHILRICNNNEVLVSINPDGTLEYGPNYNPDEAAKIFWDAVVRLMPVGLKS